MLSILSFFLIGLATVQAGEQPGYGGRVSGADRPGTDLGVDLKDFLNLNEKLPQAVCDELVASRAPTLEALHDHGIGGNTFFGTRVRLAAPMDERELIRFLLGDPQALAGAPKTRALWEAAGSSVKKQISMEICTGVVTPGKFRKMLDASPSWFLQGDAGEDFERPGGAAGVGAGATGAGAVGVTLWVADVEGRFAKIRSRWWVGGWVESYEVLAARADKRLYRRLATPVTNRTQFIALFGREGLPLGFLAPSNEAPITDWQRLRAQADLEWSRTKQVEVYRALMEIEAFEVLEKIQREKPELADSIRKLQEYYRNLLGAYQIYPAEDQFIVYAKKARAMMSEKEIKAVLDAGFWTTLADLRLNGAYVSFHLFAPDSKLQGMYLEYRDRLGQMMKKKGR